jgi:hypothetical protein
MQKLHFCQASPALIFGLGIAISGMANPAKVLNFFDVAGSWDPSLIFVMGGALITTAIGYFLVFRSRQEPGLRCGAFICRSTRPSMPETDWRLGRLRNRLGHRRLLSRRRYPRARFRRC